MSKIPITEIFPTIAGEGPKLGVPSLFVRCFGCDSRCQFRGVACDTPYSVHTVAYLDEHHPELKYGYGKPTLYTPEELVNIITSQPIRNIVLTGGHPILYQDSLLEVITALNSVPMNALTFEFETQGTIPIKVELAEQLNTYFNVSVKLKSSNQEEGYDKKRINVEALMSFPLDRSVYKFVITDPENDLEEIYQILKIRWLPVYVMPEGMTRVDVLKNSPTVVDIAIKNGWRFSPREHINIWDQKKGV